MNIKKRISQHLRSTLLSLGYGASPSFLIIGAQKAGTGGLYTMLCQHPQILGSEKKEVHYFDDGRIKYGNRKEYMSYFPMPYHLKPNKLTFEASPLYLYHPLCAQRIAEFNPKIKLITILREPVSRAFSAYNFYASIKEDSKFGDQKEKRNFSEIARDEMNSLIDTNFFNNGKSYIKRGIYAFQIAEYFKYFNRNQILILEYSALTTDVVGSMKKVADFLNIDSEFKFRQEFRNRTTYSEPIASELKSELLEFYRPHNKELFSLIGEEFQWG